jgi:hypothetical protein
MITTQQITKQIHNFQFKHFTTTTKGHLHA